MIRTTQEYAAFSEAVSAAEWAAVVIVGERLLAQAPPESEIAICLQMCIAKEHLGQWLEIGPVAERGVQACDDTGVADSRLATLLRSLGKGFWHRQQYDLSLQTYERLYALAVVSQWSDEAELARYSMACCYEALGRGEAALAMYREFIRIPNGPLRLSAVCNVAKLLTERGDCDKAYDVVANTLLLCPADERRGPAWGTMLRILAELEIGRGRLDVALIAVEDALEFIPENRPAALAKAHGVRALAKCSVGDVEEAKEALELAWSLACESCSEDAGEFLKRIEGLISGGDS